MSELLRGESLHLRANVDSAGSLQIEPDLNTPPSHSCESLIKSEGFRASHCIWSLVFEDTLASDDTMAVCATIGINEIYNKSILALGSVI